MKGITFTKLDPTKYYVAIATTREAAAQLAKVAKTSRPDFIAKYILVGDGIKFTEVEKVVNSLGYKMVKK